MSAAGFRRHYSQEGVDEDDWQASVKRKNEAGWRRRRIGCPHRSYGHFVRNGRHGARRRFDLNSLFQPEGVPPRPEVELMAGERPLVSVVDDDESVRESLPDLLNEFGYAARTFASASDFLTSDALERSQCLILDIAMPGMNGIELQAELKRTNKRIPIIFISAARDEAIRARVVELGAAACLPKPFSDTVLLEVLRSVMPPI